MDENTREIEGEIAATRARLDVNLRELESRVKSVTDWRWHYRRHAGAALAVGVCGGLILESLTNRRRRGSRRARVVETVRTRHLVETTRKPSRIGNLFEKLVLMASTRAFNVAADRIVAGLKSYASPVRPPTWFPGQAQATRTERPHAVVRGA